MTHLNTKLLMLTGLVLLGSSGMASAEADYHDVVRDTEGLIVHSSNGNCVRTQWSTDQDPCASETCSPQVVTETVHQRRETRTSMVLSQKERTVYFNFNSAALMPEAKERLDTLANALKSNASVKDAIVIGYADRIGGASYNQQLSQKRAEKVRDYLVANGYTKANVTETRWVGKSEPTASCPTTKNRKRLIECLHSDRRVEVEIEYYSEGAMPNVR